MDYGRTCHQFNRETDTQFPGVRQHDIAMLVNLSFTLTLCNYSFAI